MDTQQEIRPGDRVTAKYGDGRVMLLVEVYDPIYYFRCRCMWADDTGTERTDLFRLDDLVPPAASSPRPAGG